MSHKAPFTVRMARLAKLAAWLFKTGRNLSRLDAGNPQARDEVLGTLGRTALEALDIRLDVDAPPELLRRHGTLVAANHVSWLDIFAMSALFPSSFIAKQEISRWPVLGRMGRNAGTVFINRNSRKDVEPINQAIGEALQNGHNVSFFPEAKTSSGLEVLPFKAALFQSAIDSRAPVQTVSLRYYDDAGRRTTLPSYADINLLSSIWRIASMKELRIRADFGQPLLEAEYRGCSRFDLKEMAERQIRETVLSDIDG